MVRPFKVVMTPEGSRRRERLVVEAAGPMAAAVEAFLRYSGGLPEAVEVDPVAGVGGPTRLALRITSDSGARFRVRVEHERSE